MPLWNAWQLCALTPLQLSPWSCVGTRSGRVAGPLASPGKSWQKSHGTLPANEDKEVRSLPFVGTVRSMAGRCACTPAHQCARDEGSHARRETIGQEVLESASARGVLGASVKGRASPTALTKELKKNLGLPGLHVLSFCNEQS